MTAETDREVESRRERLLFVLCVFFGGATLLTGAVAFVASGVTATTFGAGLIVALCGVVLVMRQRIPLRLASHLVVYGCTAILVQAIILDQQTPLERGLLGLGLMVVAAGVLLGAREAKVLGALCTLFVALLFGVDIVRAELTLEVIVRDSAALCFFPVVVAIVAPFVDRSEVHVQKLARRLLHTEELATELTMATNQLESAALQISVMSQEQRQGAIQQSSAIKEVLEAMHSMSSSSHEITGAARSVVTNADLALANSERVGERVADLTSHLQRITATLQTIASIARKSELLALNASLEGTRAGEAGRGFSLVASQMQGLAENVMASVKAIKSLTSDVRQATRSTERSMEEATDIARTTASAARHINLVSQHQRSATDQVTNAISDIDEITSQVADSNEQTWAATEDLGDLAYRLNQLVDKLVLKTP